MTGTLEAMVVSPAVLDCIAVPKLQILLVTIEALVVYRDVLDFNANSKL